MKKIFHNFIRGIESLAIYFNVVWGDRDWDYHFLLSLIQFKLSKMYNYFMESNIIIDEERKEIVKQLKIAECAAKRLIDDNYCEQAWKLHYEKFPFKFEEIVDEKGNKITRVESPSKEESEEYKKIVELEEKERETDEDLLFNTMKQYYRGWWD